jgi:mono/diheme cytochrome c family protein
VHVPVLRSIVDRFTYSQKRRCALKNRFLLLALLSLAFAVWALAQKDQPPAKDSAPEYKIPPEAAAKANPVKPTADSLAKGKKIYLIDCEMCHGKAGDGKGDLGADYKTMPDFTNPETLKNRTDGELFYVTRNGKGDMPPEDNRAKDDDIWNMVNYLKAFAKK